MRLPHLLVATSLVACQTTSDPDELDFEPRDSGGIVDGTPQADAILVLANTLSEEELDLDAKLDTRVARNIVAHRNGPDQLPGSEDDDAFDSIDELDDVPFLGVTTFQALLAYAIGHDHLPNTCSSDVDCGGHHCVLGTCVSLADEVLPGALFSNTTQVRVAVSPTGVLVASASKTSSSTNVRVYDRVTGMVTSINRFLQVVPLVDSEGRFEAFTGIAGSDGLGIGVPNATLCTGAGNIRGYSIVRSAAGELVAAIDRNSSSGQPARLVVCRKGPLGSLDELVLPSPASDAAPPFVRFDQLDRAQVLASLDGKLVHYRQGLDVWLPTTLASDLQPGTLRVVQGGLVTHVFYTAKPVGMAPAKQRYLAITDDGVEWEASLPIVSAATLVDVAVDGEGRGHALFRGAEVGGRVPLSVARVDLDGAMHVSPVGNPETAQAVLAGLAIGADGLVHLAMVGGNSGSPGVLRTLSPL